MNKVSCILTSYNRPNLVQEAIRSVLSQTYADWELLVMDDGSDAPTRVVLDGFASDKVKIYPVPRIPYDHCRYAWLINMALRNYVTGGLVTYLTDDDYYLPQRFERMVALFENPDIWIVYGDQYVMDMTSAGQRIRNLRGLFGVTRSPQCRIDHNSFMHRTACLEKLTWPFWPENDWMNGDAGFFTRLVEHWDFYPVNEILDVHRWHPNNIQMRIMRGQDPVYSEEL